MFMTCDTGNAHSPGAPELTLQWRLYVFHFYLLILPMSGQVFCRSTILILIALVWTEETWHFTVETIYWDEAFQCCCIWI